MAKQAVCGIIFNEGKFLLIKRRDIPVWVLPGGGIETGESPETAVLRELEEETGYKTKIERKIAEYLPANKLSQVTYFFECSIISGNPLKGNETKDIHFFSLEDLPEPLAPPYRGWILDALARNPSFIKKKIEGTSYLHLIKFLLTNPILTIRFLLTRIGIHFNSKD